METGLSGNTASLHNHANINKSTVRIYCSIVVPGHGSGLGCCYYCCYCCWLQCRGRAEQWVAPRGSSPLEMAQCPVGVVLGDGHDGQSGECCCGCGCAESRWSAERTTPASSLNGSGSGTSDQGRGLRTGSAADSRMGVWAWLCWRFLPLYLTNLVCCHLMGERYMISKTEWDSRLICFRAEKEES